MHFFPPGFSNRLETYECEGTGVTFQAGYDSLEGYQPPKVIKYDAGLVLATLGPWRALVKETVGDVQSSPQGHKAKWWKTG